MEKLVKPILFGQLVIYSLSLLITPVSLEKGVILAILSALYSFFEFKAENKQITELKKEIADIKTELLEQQKFSQELSSHVSSIKMGQQIKSVGRF